MIRRPPRSTRTDTLFPYTTLFRSAIAGQAQGDLAYFDGAMWTRLPANTNGLFLQTQGAGANPQWAVATQPGMITAYGGVAIPNGYLFLNGQNLDQSNYADLYGAVGSFYDRSAEDRKSVV